MSTAKKNSEFEISKVLPDLARDQGWDIQLDKHSVFLHWEQLVEEEISHHARPLKIERSTLWLEVENSSWLQQLQYAKLEILEALNRSLQLSSLRDIKMVLPKQEWMPHGHPPPEVVFVRPTAAQIESFERQAECIADTSCREALIQFWYLAQACKRKEK